MKHGPYPAGDPELHRYIGELLYKGTQRLSLSEALYIDVEDIEGGFEAAETHLLASGTRDSARLLAEMFVQWATAGGSPGTFALRGTLPYVLRPLPARG